MRVVPSCPPWSPIVVSLCDAVTPRDRVYRVLALCTQRPGNPHVTAALPQALAVIDPRIDLVQRAEEHGLAPLVLAHLRAAKVIVPAEVNVALFARQVQHVRAAVVRTRVVGDVVRVLARAEIPVLVLKGAALAALVYGDSAHRPMRDVDLLLRRADARRAFDELKRAGFSPKPADASAYHHHLPALVKVEDDVSVVIELHHELLTRAPFATPVEYDTVAASAQAFSWAGQTMRTLGREDMLWHVYAHAFDRSRVPAGLRLISIADLVHAIEAWADELDWDTLRRRHGRLVRALAHVGRLTPWSDRVADRLELRATTHAATVAVSPGRAVSTSPHWSSLRARDVCWPPDWWFQMRYGINGPMSWLWYRVIGHPCAVLAAGAATAARGASRYLRGNPAGHHLLEDQV